MRIGGYDVNRELARYEQEEREAEMREREAIEDDRAEIEIKLDKEK